MERGQRASDAQARQRLVATQRKVGGLASLSDGELIAAAQARTSLSYPYHEMEMQRRLKDSVDALAAEMRRARWWAFWGTAVIVVLTVALIVLAVKP
jgi:hypothetical protein